MKISHLAGAAVGILGAAASIAEGCSGSENGRHPCYQRAQCVNEPYPTNDVAQACGFLYNDPTCGSAYAALVGCKLQKAVCNAAGKVDDAQTNAACEAESNAYSACKRTDGGVDGGCVPRTCTQLGATCGTPSDGCGGTLRCGVCSSPQICGAQTPYRCGTTCVPLTCTPADGGASRCGQFSNGCGGILSCSNTCPAPQTCGGGGVPNQCGCAPSGSVGPLGANNVSTTTTVPLADGGSSQVTWSSPAVVNAVDGNYAFAALTPGQVSNYLTAIAYNLNVPNNSTITGIQVDVTRSSQSGLVVDQAITLMKADAIVTTTPNHVASSAWPTSMQTQTYGGPTDLWGLTWNAAEINAGGFGVAFAARNSGTSNTDTARVDAIRVTVYYAGATCN